MASAPLPVRVAVVDEHRFVDRFQLRDEPVMDDAVGEVRRVDLARLGSLRDEAGRRPRLPAALAKLLVQFDQPARPAKVERELVMAGHLLASRPPPRVVQRAKREHAFPLKLTDPAHRDGEPVVVAVVVVDVAVVGIDVPRGGRGPGRRFPEHLGPFRTSRQVARRRHALASEKAARVLSF